MSGNTNSTTTKKQDTKRNSNVAEEQATKDKPYVKEETTATEARKITPNKTFSDAELESRMEELLAEKLAKREANSGELGVRVTDIKVSEGKIKVDSDNNPVINPKTEEVERWSDSYYVDISFMGGSATIWLNDKLGSQLEKGKRYYATTEAKIVTNKEGKSSIGLGFVEFEKII